MKKNEPLVHCLLTFFQNLETVGETKQGKETSSPANVFLHKGFRFDYKHMQSRAHTHTLTHTSIPPVEADIFQGSYCSKAISESQEASAACWDLAGKELLLLFAAGVKQTLERRAAPGVIAAQVPAWALRQAGRNGQTPLPPEGKNTPLEDTHYFNTLNVVLKYGPIVEGVLGEPGLFRPRSWTLKLGMVGFSPTCWMSHYSPTLTAFFCELA